MAQQPGQASMDMAAAANMRSRLTPRQKRLNRLWAFARVSEHDHKKYDWDGREIPTIDDTDAIVQTGYIPPGFVELGAGGTLPLKYRRPTAPLGVVRKIVGRFTGLLFSERRRPRISVTDDPDTEDFLAALIRQGRFWRVAIKARNYGGGMGTAILGFKFINGRIRFEAPDPRWCEPKFADPEEFILESLTIRHEEEKTVYDRDGSPLTKKFWYRRVVDAQEDRVWRDVEITAEEPDWDALSQDEEVCAAVTHGLGFCPFVWIQNLPNDDEIDGDPDAHGVYPLVEAADVLVAQAHRGTVANCDPTLFVSSDDELGTVAKGSDNAIKLGSGSSVSYLELQGTSADAAWRQAEKLEERAYRLARCVSDDVLARSDVPRTATEIVSLFADMLEQAEMLRDQYGPALELLFEMVELAVRTLQEPQIVNGVAQRAIIQLPDRMVTQDGETFRSPRELGPGGDLIAVWGPFSKPPMTDIETAVRTMGDATMNSFASKKHAMRFLAPYLDYSDPAAMQREMDEEAAEQAAAAQEEAPPEDTSGGGGGEGDGTDPRLFQFTAEEAKIGLCTINEYRQGRGCGALPDGDLTLPQYMAKHPEVFIAATAVTSAEAGKAFFGMEETAENPPQLSPNPEPGPPVEHLPTDEEPAEGKGDEEEPPLDEETPEEGEDEGTEGEPNEDALEDEQEPEDADVSGP